MEKPFEKLDGVVSVFSGYTGGTTKNPNYKNYASGGHIEVVEIEYDPDKISYGALLDVYLYGNINIRAVVSRKTPLLDRSGYAVPVTSFGNGFNIYSADREMVSRMFGNKISSDALNQILMKCRRGQTLQIYFQKNRIFLRSRFSEISGEELRTYLNGLEVLAEIIENR